MGKKKHRSKSKKTPKPKSKKRVQLELTKGADSEILDWAKQLAADSSTPERARDLLLQLSEVLESGAHSEDSLDKMRMHLAIAMRITPSSERCKDLPGAEHELDERIAELDKKAREARKISKYSSRKANAFEKERDELIRQRAESQTSSDNEEGASDPDDVGAPTEDEKEGVFSASPVLNKPSGNPLLPSVPEEGQKGLIVSAIERRRDDLMFVKSAMTFTGQEFFNPVTGEKIYYDFSEIGPPGTNLTYRACVVMALQVAGLGMPISRVERMLGGGSFSRQSIHRTLGYVAYHLLPIYNQLISELAEAKVIGADDTYTRVNEVSRYFKRPGSAKPPWERFEEKKKEDSKDDQSEKREKSESDSEAEQKIPARSVAAAMAKVLRYSFDKVGNSEKLKTQHLTTCIHGIPESSRTRIVVYRSHLGSVGNLLDQVLARRSSENKKVTIVADLSTSNRVRDSKVLGNVDIEYAGCAAHARRPFFRHMKDDIELCIEILDHFKYIFEVESIIKSDSPSEKVRWRNNKSGSAKVWADLLKECEEITQKYSASTNIGAAARYVTKNYDALTLYLQRGELPADNNLTERLLRFEKLAERNTYGSKTIEGRTRMDVLRSLVTSTRYSKLDESLYLLKVLSVPRSEIEKSPEKYTPHAIKKHFDRDDKDRDHFTALLNTTDYRPFVKTRSSFERGQDEKA